MSPKEIKKLSSLHGFTKSFCQLVLVAQGFKVNSWIASLMGIQALGSSLDERNEGSSSCYKPLSPTEGQELPWQGLTWILPVTVPFCTLISRWWVQTRRLTKCFSATKIHCSHEGMCPCYGKFSYHIPIQLAQCYQDPTILCFQKTLQY